jgi:hypothetical protein
VTQLVINTTDDLNRLLDAAHELMEDASDRHDNYQSWRYRAAYGWLAHPRRLPVTLDVPAEYMPEIEDILSAPRS